MPQSFNLDGVLPLGCLAWNPLSVTWVAGCSTAFPTAFPMFDSVSAVPDGHSPMVLASGNWQVGIQSSLLPNGC